MKPRRLPDALLVLVVALCVLLDLGCAGSQRRTRRLSRPPRSLVVGTPGPVPAPSANGDAVVDASGDPRDRSAGEAPPAPDADEALEVQRRDVRIAFSLDEATPGGPATIDLGARITKARGVRGPGVVFVPGAGDVSRDGTRKGDGVVTYTASVDVTRAWADAFAARGAVALAWDKRTCGANDVAVCTTNPQADVDERGPAALARDVDEACAVVRREPDFDGRLVLFAHAQAAQVALASSCATAASAIVLLAPVPRAVDDVIVGAIVDRQRAAEADARAAATPEDKARAQGEAARLKNLAGSRAASFASMRDGRFAADARVDGATIAYWLAWRALTEQTPALLVPVKDKVIVVVGGADLQLSADDRAAAAALPSRRALVIDHADHHLLVGEQLAPVVTEPVFSAIDELLEAPRL